MEKIERSPQTDAGPTGPLLAMAGAMTTAEREVADLVLTLPKLRALAKRYRDMAGDVARNARDFVTAIDKIDAAAMSKAQIGLEAGVKREDPIIKQVNTYCHQP